MKFLFDTLVQIRIELNNSKLGLRKWAEKVYGEIDPEIKKLSTFLFLWKKNDLDIVYSHQTVGNKTMEFLEIRSSKFNKLFYKRNSLYEVENNGKK